MESVVRLAAAAVAAALCAVVVKQHAREVGAVLALAAGALLLGAALGALEDVRALVDELGERSLSQLWREAVADTPLDLTGGERLALEELGDVLGRYDGEEQRSALARTRAELSRALEQAREETEKQGRMYRALGLTAGALLAILLL